MTDTPVLRQRPRIALPAQSNVWLVNAWTITAAGQNGCRQGNAPSLISLGDDGLTECVFASQQYPLFINNGQRWPIQLVARGSSESVNPTTVKKDDILLVNMRDYTSSATESKSPIDSPELAMGRVWRVVGVGSPHGQPQHVRLIMRPALVFDMEQGIEFATMLYTHPGLVVNNGDVITAGFKGQAGHDVPWFTWTTTQHIDLTNAVNQLVDRFNAHADDYSSLEQEVTDLRERVRQLERLVRGGPGAGEGR